MLIIDREPLYKNKFFLGGIAVLSGFLLTMGIIRLTSPINDATSESTQSTSDRRAASLIPIPASDSESSSEDGSSDEKPTSSTSNAGAGAASSKLISPSSSNWANTGTQQSTQAQPTPSGGSATTSTTPSGSGGSGQTGGTSTDGQPCTTTSLGLTLSGKLLNGICVAI